MSTHALLVRKHPDSGLLYAVADGEAAIVGCTLLNQSHVDIPPVLADGDAQYPVTAIGEAAFSYMSALKSVSLPATLRCIGHGAFEHTGLTEIHLNDGLTTLSPYAFFSCVKLSRVSLPPHGLNGLPAQVFGGCTALHSHTVTNLSQFSREEITASGLQAEPERSAQPSVSAGQSACEETPQELLQHGLLLEAEGQHSEAAVYYMQAHILRAKASSSADLQARVTDLSAIAEAEYHLGVLLKLNLAPECNGDGSPRPSAAQLLHSAADTGSIADAMYHLGDMYAGGYDVTADAAAALKYLKKAVAIGHERACLDLAYVYLDGTLDHADSDAALLYLRKCAEFNGPYAPIAAEEITLLEEAAAMYQQMLHGDNGAAYTLYLLLKERPYVLSKATAMDCLLKAADLRHPQAVDEMHSICVSAGDFASAYRWKSLLETLRSH